MSAALLRELAERVTRHDRYIEDMEKEVAKIEDRIEHVERLEAAINSYLQDPPVNDVVVFANELRLILQSTP